MKEKTKLVKESKTTIFLFASVCLLWGFTWIMGKYQQHANISLEFALGYRFLFASFIMFITGFFLRQEMKLSFYDFKIFLTYVLIGYSLNYIIFYYVAALMPTALSAIIFSFSIVIIAVSKHLLKISIDSLPRILFSALIGIIGLVCILTPKLKSGFQGDIILPILLATFATFLYSFGLVYYDIKKSHIKLQTVSSLMYIALIAGLVSMLYGVIYDFILNRETHFIPIITPPFVFSFFYLVMSGSFGSLFIFLLIKRIGSVRAAYANLLTPVLAMLASAYLENYHLSGIVFFGILLIIISNYIVLTKKSHINSQETSSSNSI